MNSPEERIAALEQGLLSIEEAITRVEKSMDKMDIAVSSLKDKFDARYPSKESVDLRFADVQRDVQQIQNDVGQLQREVGRLRAWQYKVMGASAVTAFLLGLAADVLHSWKG